MTDLSRERLAELRGIAESVHHPFRWYAAHDLMRGHAMADEDAHLIAAMAPSMCLALIAQCESSLSPESGPVSGDANARMLELHSDPAFIGRLRHVANEDIYSVDEVDRDKVSILLLESANRLSASNAALAEAVGLLDEASGEMPPGALDDKIDAFLAKHGKTEEAA